MMLAIKLGHFTLTLVSEILQVNTSYQLEVTQEALGMILASRTVRSGLPLIKTMIFIIIKTALISTDLVGISGAVRYAL